MSWTLTLTCDISPPKRDTQRTKIGKALEPEEEDKDMLGINPNFMCHRLSVNPNAKPMAQKKRKQGEEKRTVVREEVSKLVTAGFVREVQYPTWLANVVMVKKANGRWRMYTDYTDLNKACPKDPYPLPSIDQLVDGVSGYALLSFMDAYSGYNQIQMHPSDEEKTTFITEEGVFCYKVIPFGLKNARATYQRLMDKIFKKTIGVDIEVYVDDMVVKSEKANRHCETLERVFKTLRDHKLKLNPEKCSFEVQAGKFLGFMLTERGIEDNPDKCQAIIDMRSPQGVKEVQQLMGKITALSRFIPRSVEMARPIFGTLKKGRRFTCTSKCEESFKKLKTMIAAPSVLTRPVPGIPLCLYFSASDNAISVVLVQESQGEQRPVYFVSKVLQGPETRYWKIEKAALALVTASRRLRSYFQNFSIIVRTDLPIRQMLGKPDLAGRMMAWSVQLSEFDISFERRSHIKAQAIEDFLWSRNHSGGTNRSPDRTIPALRVESQQQPREYKALLVGMKLAQELGTKKLTVKSDSKLVTGQINGDYQAKDPQLAKYRDRASAMASSFDNFVLLHVPRD
ncbi:Retrovirus-related Pol polyprotein, partial [Mucuna pruriens]